MRKFVRLKSKSDDPTHMQRCIHEFVVDEKIFGDQKEISWNVAMDFFGDKHESGANTWMISPICDGLSLKSEQIPSSQGHFPNALKPTHLES